MTEPDPTFEALLEHLKSTRGFDFTGYKRSSLMRRVDRRMAQVGITSYADYLDHLELHGDEFTALFNTILINVTGFFRDMEAWEHLRDEVLPGLLAARRPTEPLRVWSAGCASGEEAYTLAMVLAELLGPAEFRDRVKIYATDVDEDALAHARQGSYSEREVRGIPSELLDRYFEQLGGRYVFRKDLRRSVIFGRNDLVQDAPISRVDLLVCRNTLMYFTADTQARVLARFHFALAPNGVLLLGKAEMLLSHGGFFTPVELRRRIFQKAPRPHQPEGVRPADGAFTASSGAPAVQDALRDEALLAAPLAQLVVTADGLVALVNRKAERLFGLSSRDVGRPFRDLEISYRPLELRRHLEQAQSERRTVRIGDVPLHGGQSPSTLDIEISPLVGGGGEIIGATVAFHDVTAFRRLKDELEQTNRQLETAYEELQSTNEELETTNEELQSTVEELETTNEELQSTNEELETMNEELQSMNDELHLANEELRGSTDEVTALNEFMSGVLGSFRAGVVVVDQALRVLAWNSAAEDLWGIRQDEVKGQHLLNLDIGLPVSELHPLLRRQVSEDGPPHDTVELAAVNRRGRPVQVRVTVSSFSQRAGERGGAVILMDPTER